MGLGLALRLLLVSFGDICFPIAGQHLVVLLNCAVTSINLNSGMVCLFQLLKQQEVVLFFVPFVIKV